jgi:hypothetical protein
MAEQQVAGLNLSGVQAFVISEQLDFWNRTANRRRFQAAGWSKLQVPSNAACTEKATCSRFELARRQDKSNREASSNY